MAYVINKTNGTIVATVQDATVDQTTDLTFVGRNFAGYGEVQNENFLKLLENFSNTTAPSKKIEGQLWYDSANKTLKVWSGTTWKSLTNIEIATADPSTSVGPVVGDFWYDTINNQLRVWAGTEYTLIGPPEGSQIKAQWRGDFEYDSRSFLPVYNIKAILGTDNEVVAIVSAESYDIADPGDVTGDSPTYPVRTETFNYISKGITLPGADADTGSSDAAGIYFWGTAAHALHSDSATTADASTGISATSTGTGIFNVPFVNTSTFDAFYNSGIRYNAGTQVLLATASAALYADIAERYEADAVYEPGTVLMIGGEKEVTIACYGATTAVAGIVSKNPAYMMNSDAGTDETHPYIALKGRVPCKICGPVKKGDLLVSSGYKHGYATKKQDHDSPNAVIGKALENFEGPFGIIEVKV
jgi:hypothetical protein